jgi:protein-S-isoprenylcysteine O-methyltransferase Ste14
LYGDNLSRPVRFFLVLLVPPLAGLLAWLGWKTLATYWMGWFLLIIGNIFFWGFIITIWIKRNPFNNPEIEGKTTHEEKGDHSFWLILPGFMIAFFFSPAEALWFARWLPHTWLMQVTGLVLVIFSSVFFVWARRTIRKNYSGQLRVTETQELIQSGPYRCIRHPAYLSYILMALGTGIGYSSLVGICSVPILLLPAFVYRIRVEERLLALRFGELYRGYASRTSHLIPWIW